MPKLSIVIPCYNEEATVATLYDEFLDVFGREGIGFEVIFINDGSKDGTMQALREVAGRKAGRVRVVNFSRNFGKDAGIYAGLKEARGEYTVIMDGDLQHPPQVVVEMVRYLDGHPEADSVAARQAQRREGRVLSLFKRMFYSVINRMSQIEFVPGASDFRAFRRNMKDAILSMTEYFRFSKGIFSFVGFDTHYITYEARERGGGVTKWSFWKLVGYAIDGIIGFSVMPLKMITLVGGGISAVSFIYMVFVILQKLVWGIDIPGYPTLVVLVLLLGGLQLFALGIIGEYLGRNYIEVKKRPIYIAKEILDNSDTLIEKERPLKK